MKHRPVLVVLILLLSACATVPAGSPPATIGEVDLTRFSGQWYEVARFTTPFQDGLDGRCEDVTATYTPRSDGAMDVVSRCRDAANGGQERIARGVARSASPGNDRLRISFQWPVSGDYWVIGLDPDYRWAVVGAPGRDQLRILSRTPVLPAGAYSMAVAMARREGFVTARLVPTPQRATESARALRFERALLPRTMIYGAGRA